MNNPTKVRVNDTLYDINTDFRIAIEVNSIAKDKNIGDYERALAIIYKLFGEAGLECKDQNKLLELGMKYLRVQDGEEIENKNEHNLDFTKCEGLIRSSFKYDYNYDPYELDYLHWYDFYNDLANLSGSEFGNCCVLNRVMSIINFDVSKIKDTKERTKIAKAKKELIRRYCEEKEVELTKEQEKSVEELYKALGYNI